MFYTRLGKIIAGIGLVLGSLRVALGLRGAYVTDDPASNAAFAREYLAARNTDEAINEGMTYIHVAVTLGVLCEISARIRDDSR